MTKEKKQTVVVGALGALLLAVGAFQFIGGGPSEPLPYGDEESDAAVEQVSETAQATVSPEDEALNERISALLSSTMSSRDPFKPKVPVETVDPMMGGGSAPSPAPSAPSNPRPSGMGGNLAGNWPDIPPLDVPGLGGNIGGGPIGIEPRESDNSGYKLAGVIVGKKRMAVIEDGEGRQRLVPLGQSIDGRAEVVGIDKDKVRIKQDGQIKELGLSEDDH